MIYGIIPARLESTRLPRKMLLAETGKPLIQHTWEAAKRATLLDRVIVATDCAILAIAMTEQDEPVVMTGEHPSGTDRIAEAARQLPDATIIVNIQGDEPEIDPEHINAVVKRLQTTDAEIVTLSAPLADGDIGNMHVVKVRMRGGGQPDFARMPDDRYEWRHHVGVYGFRADALQRAVALPQTRLEIGESLEQLRWIDAGFKWDVVQVGAAATGIDTPEDYRRFVERVQNGNG